MILDLSTEDENLPTASITLDILGITTAGGYDCLIKTVLYTEKDVAELLSFFK